MGGGRRSSYAIATVLLIAVGLTTRWPTIGWPPELAKYLGSALWGAMVYCVVGFCLHARPIWQVASLAFIAAVATEFSQLWHPAWLDAFRRTTIGVLLLGRYFSWADIAAYAVGIGAAGLLTALLRSRSVPS